VAAAALGKCAWGISFERPWYADVMALAEAACARPEMREELMAKALAATPDSGLGKRFNAASDFIPAGPAITSGWTLSGSRAAVVVEEGGYPPQAMATVLVVDADSGRELLRHAEIVRGTPGMMVPAPVFAGQNVIAALGPNKLIGLNSATGTTEWEYPMPDGVVGPLMLAGNMMFVRTRADSIVAFRIAPTLLLPGAFALSQNMPNPFRRITILRFAVPKNVNVSLRIFSGNGTLVKTIVDEKKNAGWYSVSWNGSDDKNRQAAAGVYLAKFNAGRYAKTIRMNLVR
jgi:outer membrane protein assembly factor BamB